MAKGLVISSNPAEGNNVAANTLVTLYVSTGAAPVTVPSVVGQQESQAEATLQAKGFNVSVKIRPDIHPALGAPVVSQSPNGGQPLPRAPR